MNIILFGPPGAGKGTQAKNLEKKLNNFQISTGDMLRDEIKNETEIGKKIINYMNDGKFVDDEIVNKLMKKAIFDNQKKGKFIFDGYPRTLEQAKNLDLWLIESNQKIDFIFFLNVSKNIIIQRIEKRKGLLESLKSMRVILDRGYSFKWDIIGDGPELNTLKNEATKLNLQENIIFHGKIERDIEKEKFLEKSDIFLMPSFQDKYSVEGFGLSYVEAAKFGIPSIAGNSGGAKEAIINNNTGWCANTQDNEELTSILIEAITNSKLRHFYGKNALKRFESELNADIVTNKLIDFIKI